MCNLMVKRISSVVLFFLLAVLALSSPGIAEAASPSGAGKIDLGVCAGKFAICATATCRRINQKVDGKEAAECECPVLNGLSLANMDAIQTCTPPAGKIYSLYSSCEPADSGENLMQCPAGSYAQCWNALCSYEEGARVARCICPVQHGPFLTPGGQCNQSNCSAQLLVGMVFRAQAGCLSKSH